MTCNIYSKEYFKNIKEALTNYDELYGIKMKDYKQVLEYCEAIRQENNKADVSLAEKDVNFIKKSEELFQKNPGRWILSKEQKFRLKLANQPAKTKLKNRTEM